MPEFTDLVRQRLASAAAADPHPDADTLTAYAEKLLSTRERGRIMDHIAACRECRDVIALSTGTGTDSAVTPVVVPDRSARRSWRPLFGLAASLAVVAVAAVFVIRMPQHKNPETPNQGQNYESKLAPPAATPGTTLNDSDKAASPANEAATRGTIAPESIARARQPESRPMALSAGFPAGLGASPAPPAVLSPNTASIAAITDSVAAKPRRDYLNDNLFANQSVPMVDDIPSSSAGRGGSSQFSNGLVSGMQLPGMADLPPSTSTTRTIRSWTPSATASSHRNVFINTFKFASRELIGRRPAISVNGLAFSAMSNQFNPATDAQNTEAMAAAPKAETAELDQSHAFALRSLSPKVSAAVDAPWVVEAGKLLRTNESGAWVSAYPGSDIEFSAVTAHGADVWAGGHHATLLHSSDGGATWERVHLGDNAVGNIKAISVMGANIQVTTSESQTWSSEDGGKTWSQN
ncbi:MAG TPA: YCF48-related protein [Candidatus Angelobacter sp.]|nr:YCF48-related protein [Candidatus Angelobacter sp.]